MSSKATTPEALVINRVNVRNGLYQQNDKLVNQQDVRNARSLVKWKFFKV